MRPTLILSLCIACLPLTAKGHEFWIEPETYQIDVGTELSAELKVGTEFEGASQVYLPSSIVRFDFGQNGAFAPVPGQLGDRPALRFAADEAGLMVLVHQTSGQFLTWSTWEKFEKFLRHKDAAWVLEAHRAAGLTENNVREVYSRYAKSLVAIGDGAGADAPTGLLTEIVALENPFTGDMSDGIEVQVLYQGAPRQNVQIEIFEKAPDGGIVVSTARTNGAGLATISVKPGHEYMLDAVVLRRPLSQPKTGAPVDWESLWANLTFAIPG